MSRAVMSRALLLVAHGSPDARAQAAIEELAAAVCGELPSVAVAVAYLEHAEPSVASAYSALAVDHDAITVVPLLLGAGYHATIDLPEQLAGSPTQITAPLGAHPLVAGALRDVLIDAGATQDATVVLVSAGSREPAAAADVDATAALVKETGGWRVLVAAPDDIATTVQRARSDGGEQVAVGLLLLAPGVFTDRISDAAWAAGADVVAEPIATHPSIAVLVALRYAASITEAAA
jgi:sirohydrochlorin ferrochelatase